MKMLMGWTSTGIWNPSQEPVPMISRTEPMMNREQVKPSPMPRPSSTEGSTLFLQANISALPRMMQFTVIRDRKVPRALCRSGTKPCIRKSIRVTNPAMMTM